MRTLSSIRTFLYKFVLSAILTLMVVIAAIAILASMAQRPVNGGTPPAPWIWIFFLLWSALIAAFVVQVIRWKRVRMDASNLHISNYFRKIQVPLTQIEAVSEQRWPTLRTVTIRLKQRGAFGDAIRFKPRSYYWFWREHPVVAELQKIAAGSLPTQQELDQTITSDRRRLRIIIAAWSFLILAVVPLLQLIFRRSDAYLMAMDALRQNPAVTAALGTPIESGLFITGSVVTSNDSGCAALQFSVHGSRETGDARVDAFEQGDTWHLSHLWVKPSATPEIEVVNTPPGDLLKRCTEDAE